MNTPDRGCIEVLDHITHVLSSNGMPSAADDLHAVRRLVSDAVITGLALVRTMTRADRVPTFDEIYTALHAHSKALTACSGDDEKRACPESHPLHRPAERRRPQ